MINSEFKQDSKSIILPVILSGGSGTRLWPLSRSSFPKQYLNLQKDDKYTLLQNTLKRLEGMKGIDDPLIICSEEHRFIVAEQIRSINKNPFSILLEPFGKNTAPAIALAALIAVKDKNDPILLILSSDHKITSQQKFQQSITDGLPFAKNNKLVTFGVVPKTPETGYGYIESAEIISQQNKSSKIKRFIEKPNQALANKLLKDKFFTWNSGIFLFKASTIINEISKYNPHIINNCKKALKHNEKDFDFQRINAEIFKNCQSISLDNAVMEKTSEGIVVCLDAGWDDLGSWKSVWDNSKSDKQNNTLIGKTFIKDVKSSYIRSESRLIVGLGLQDILIIETNDALLVAQKNSINKLKDFIKELDEKNIEEIKVNKKVYRPWGNYMSLIKEKNWQVKRLEINPNSSLSLQLHYKRSEHWVVVKNKAKVELDNKVLFLNENESIYIPLKSKHRLTNPSNEPLILIEVQTGSYLGEDDIVRFMDNYKRN